MIAQDLREKYVKHVLKWEGKLSNDPDDTAAKCAPFKGAFHTNKGVTYCTFQTNALSLGIARTYNRFVELSDADVSKFVQVFTDAAEASDLPDRLALSVTEAAWGSGPSRAVKHLQDAINALGRKVDVDGDMGNKTLTAALSLPEDALYLQYWDERQQFLDMLTLSPKFKKWKNGWNNRLKSFRALFG